MKSFTIVSSLAAGAAATIPGFLNANPFSCPGTVNNKCTPKQSSGWDYSDLQLGPVGQYNGLGYQGWTCQDDVVKRGSFSRRTGGRFVGASCGPDKSKAPSFGCGASKEIESFSLTEIFVSVEFDTELEFHYGMPDGSNCKIRRPCSKSGTKISNAQCGGAKNVSVVYPYQPNKPKFPKPSCSVGLHSMSFDCHSTTTRSFTKTLPPATYTTSATTSTTYSQVTSASSTSPVSQPPPVSTYTTSLTTSTIYTTSTQTYTACGRTISNCPAGNVSTVIVTVPVSTTICPVTLTQTLPSTSTYVAPPPPAQSSSTLPLTTTLGVPGNTYTTTPTTPSLPVGTLPCPSLVPQCLNTFLFQLTCADNTDHACYCPNALFVSSVFNCFYAHGESDVVISQAVVFFQGLCAQYVPSNPAIVTAPTVTSYLTATATSTLSAVYTTVVVVGTTAVPCTNSEGAVIPGSSTIATYTNAMTVPQVGFSTGPSGGVGVIPITPPVQAGVSQPTTYNLISSPPVITGTGSYVAAKPTGSTVVTAGAARHGAAGVAGLAAVAAVVALL